MAAPEELSLAWLWHTVHEPVTVFAGMCSYTVLIRVVDALDLAGLVSPQRLCNVVSTVCTLNGESWWRLRGGVRRVRRDHSHLSVLTNACPAIAAILYLFFTADSIAFYMPGVDPPRPSCSARHENPASMWSVLTTQICFRALQEHLKGQDLAMVTRILQHLGVLQIFLAGMLCLNYRSKGFLAAASISSWATAFGLAYNTFISGLMPRAGVPAHNLVPWMVFFGGCAALQYAHSKELKSSAPDMTDNVKAVDYFIAAVFFIAAVCATVFPGDTLIAYYPKHAKASAHAEACFFVVGTSLLNASSALCGTIVKPSANTVKKIFFALAAAFMVYNKEYDGVYQQLAVILAVTLTAFYHSPKTFF